MSDRTQSDRILEWLQIGGAVTALQALDMIGTMRLGARIFDLRQRGYKIVSHRITLESGKSVSQYTLAP